MAFSLANPARTLAEHLANVDRLRCSKKIPQARFKRLEILEFALPDLLDGPAYMLQIGPDLSISRAVPLDLGFPEYLIRFRELADPATVTMPKAPVNEDRLLATDECDVRTPWQILSMEPKTIAQPMKEHADGQLGLGMLRAYPRHQSATARRCSVIHHDELLYRP
jgi:hypothetical protein